MLLTRLILGPLGIIQVECINLAYQKSFDTGLITPSGYFIGFLSYSQLLRLIIEMLHKQKNILIEIHLLLPNARRHDLPVTLGHPHLTSPLTPVQQRYLYTYLHNLIVLKMPVSR